MPDNKVWMIYRKAWSFNANQWKYARTDDHVFFSHKEAMAEAKTRTELTGDKHVVKRVELVPTGR